MFAPTLRRLRAPVQRSAFSCMSWSVFDYVFVVWICMLQRLIGRCIGSCWPQCARRQLTEVSLPQLRLAPRPSQQLTMPLMMLAQCPSHHVGMTQLRTMNGCRGVIGEVPRSLQLLMTRAQGRRYIIRVV